jgi:hypothetical protein
VRLEIPLYPIANSGLKAGLQPFLVPVKIRTEMRGLRHDPRKIIANEGPERLQVRKLLFLLLLLLMLTTAGINGRFRYLHRYPSRRDIRNERTSALR